MIFGLLLILAVPVVFVCIGVLATIMSGGYSQGGRRPPPPP